MTEYDKALVEQLLEEASTWDEPKYSEEIDMIGMLTKAADRIEALSAEKEDARMEERAAIVAWLMREEENYPSTEYSRFVAMICVEIENGKHLK